MKSKDANMYKHTITEIIVLTIQGLSGGLAAVLVASLDKTRPKKISKMEIIGFMVIGLMGSFYLGPMVVDYFKLTGGQATGAGFLTATFSYAILRLLGSIWEVLIKDAPEIIKNYIRSKFNGNP